MVQIKRVYDPVAEENGTRILVDRVWPPWVSKAKARIDRWAKELGPSTQLRRWFGHDPDKWTSFKDRYIEELIQKGAELEALAHTAEKKTLTLVYGARDTRHNQAVVLKQAIESPPHLPAAASQSLGNEK
jgi:uncharacterized protein YeaO (DUF488 family)